MRSSQLGPALLEWYDRRGLNPYLVGLCRARQLSRLHRAVSEGGDLHERLRWRFRSPQSPLFGGQIPPSLLAEKRSCLDFSIYLPLMSNLDIRVMRVMKPRIATDPTLISYAHEVV